jgi:DNA-binding NtrC family response regulator
MDPAESPKTGKRRNGLAGAGAKVLIVDDEESVRNALRRVLEREGYDIITVGHPTKALEVLEREPVDVLITDERMPGMTGMELLTLVRDRYPDTLRIILTGHADLGVAIQAINQGEIYRFLTKPWDDVELKVTLFLAVERLRLERVNQRLVDMLRTQQQVLTKLAREHPALATALQDAETQLRVELADHEHNNIRTLPRR